MTVKQTVFPTTRFLGWWVVTRVDKQKLAGQIVGADEVFSVVRFAEFDDCIANTALLDSRISQIYPSKRDALKAVQQ